MNIPKSRVVEDSKHPTNIFSQLNHQASVNTTKHPSTGFKNFVDERRKGGNKLLFGITVAALTMIMGGSIYFAVNHYQQSTTSSHLINNK